MRVKHPTALERILAERIFIGGCIHTRRYWLKVFRAEGFSDFAIDCFVFRPEATDAPEQCLGVCMMEEE